MRRLSEAQASRCEHATQPRCQCRCHGSAHGLARGDVLDLPEDDIHHSAPPPKKRRGPRLFSNEEMAELLRQAAGFVL